MAFHLTCWTEKYGSGTTTGNRAFAAVYASTCTICKNPINVGQTISYTKRPGRPAKFKVEGEAPTPTPAVVPVTPTVDVDAIVQACLEKLPRPVIVTHTDTGEIINVGVQHAQFDTLLSFCRARVNTMIVGPAGSGKTTAAKAVAKALDVEFYYVPAFSDPFTVLGYNDAHGRYVRTPARDAYEHGGVILFDEIDGCDPNAMVALNALIENDKAAFPDGMVQKHRDCIIIAAANTFGHGGTSDYVGRNKLDGASLDRFAVLEWSYDEAFELAIAPDPEYTRHVQKIRARAKERGLRVLVTPRASIKGGALIKAGVPRELVDAALLRKGLPDDTWNQLTA